MLIMRQKAALKPHGPDNLVMFQRWALLKVTLSAIVLAGFLGGCAIIGVRYDEEATASGSNGPSQKEERPEWLIGPLEEFMERILGPGNFFFSVSGAAPTNAEAPLTAAPDREFMRREEAIAACMHNQGFKYYPLTFTRITYERPAGTFIPADTREWAQTFGFGHITASDPGRWDTRWGSRISEDRSVFRLRELQQAEMSPAERVAFDLALHGNRDRIRDLLDSADWVELPDYQALELGCENFVTWQVAQTDSARFPDDDGFSGIRNAVFEGFGTLTEADQRVQQLTSDWATCMAVAGFPAWANPWEASQAIAEEVWSGEPTFDPSVFANWDWDNNPGGPPRLDRSEMRAREIAVAVASWDCRDQLGFDAAVREVNLDLQQQFVVRHWLALEDWARAVEAGLAREGRPSAAMLGLTLVTNALHQ